MRDLRFTPPSSDVSAAASPQTAPLGWRERYGSTSHDLVFTVDRMQVLRDGWKARIGIANHTSNAYDLGDSRASLDSSFGVMLFPSNSESELDDRNRKGTLPPVREATRFEPSLPKVLESGQTWQGTISAPGALAARSWVRFVFGPLLVIGKPASGTPSTVVWITDHTHQLRS